MLGIKTTTLDRQNENESNLCVVPFYLFIAGARLYELICDNKAEKRMICRVY